MWKIVEVREVVSIEEVNALLKGDWKIIDTYIPIPNKFVFVLGRSEWQKR